MRGVLRRSSKAMTRQDAESFLRDARVGHLGTLGPDGYPYVIPLFFTYEDGTIYFHSASEGHKVDNILYSPLVCFEASSFGEVIPGADPCSATASYESVVAFGRARMVDDLETKQRVLRALSSKYGVDAETLPRTSTCIVLAVDVSELTGKRNPAR